MNLTATIPRQSRIPRQLLGLMAVLALGGVLSACQDPLVGQNPRVTSTSPAAGATNVKINRQLNAVFDRAMNSTTINKATFTLSGPAGAPVTGTVNYVAVGNAATFTPDAALAVNTAYSATLAVGIQDPDGHALALPYSWSFTTGAVAAAGPETVPLRTAGDYVILAKSKVSTTGTTHVTGNIGLSPAAQTFLTGFSETLAAGNAFATSSLVTGKLFAANMPIPTPGNLTTAIGDMQTAYTDAAGRALPDFTEKGAGNISGLTLAPGLYKWGTGVQINTDVTLSGGANDTWIFQIAKDLTVANGVHVTLGGAAQAANVFWQVAGQTTLGTTSSFKGDILCQTQIVLQTGATLSGRALAQTAVTLDASVVTLPPM